MVTVNYQTFGNKGFQLRLRLYNNGETRFINVTKRLKGDIKKSHWNARRQRFVPSCPFSEENNEFLSQFRQKYDMAAIGWNGSVSGMILHIENNEVNEGRLKFSDYLNEMVKDLKTHRHEDGTIKGTYENYEKLGKRVEEFCQYSHIRYDLLEMAEINPVFVNKLFNWVRDNRKGKGIGYISSALHALIGRANKDEILNMADFNKCHWNKKKSISSQKYHTLTPDQCRKFVSMDISELPKNPKVRVYYDFCVFILYTGQSVCDAASLKMSDIKKIDGVEHLVFKRRKIKEKQSHPCIVPVNKVMKQIIKRQSMLAADGYIFPIRSKKKIATQTTNNGDIKHFISRVNLWLKKVGVLLKCDFRLHTYVFRHTAITHYISQNIPVAYVSNIMGTSIKNCETIYYNNMGDYSSRDKVINAVDF